MSFSVFFLAAMAVTGGFINSAFALGGGVFLIATMPGQIPLNAVVPLHGLSILSNNILRSALDWRSINWVIMAKIAVGSVFGVLAGVQVLPYLPTEHLPLILGITILVLTWIPHFSISTLIPGAFILCGFLQTFTAMLIGSTGPLVMVFFINRGMNRNELVANTAMVAVIADVIKIFGFLYIGFPYADYLPEIVVLMSGMALGAILGKLVRGRLPARFFATGLKLLISALAVQMLVKYFLA